MPPVKRWLVPATTLLLLRAVPSCSSDAATAVPTEIPLRDIPVIFAQKACEVTLDCLGPVADIAALRSDCVERVTRQFEDGEFALYAGSIERGVIDYDSSLVAACTQSLEDAGCGILTNRFESLCPDLFKGHAGDGEDCSVDAQCEGGHFCGFASTCPGTCEPLSAEGEACVRHNDCSDGLICSALKCVSPAADGDACGGPAGASCRLTSICAAASATESGTCTSVEDAFSRDEGAACDPGKGEFCKTDFVCAAVAIEDAFPVLRCEPPGEGTACHVAVPEMCPAEQFCVLAEFDLPLELPYRVELPGECQPLPGDGEPCGTAQPGRAPSYCRSNTVCVAGTCRDVKRLGGGCSDGGECYSGVCKEGTCTATLCGAE